MLRIWICHFKDEIDKLARIKADLVAHDDVYWTNSFQRKGEPLQINGF